MYPVYRFVAVDEEGFRLPRRYDPETNRRGRRYTGACVTCPATMINVISIELTNAPVHTRPVFR